MIINNYASYAGVRMEWSKGWGYSAEGAWQNQDILRNQVPRSYNQGQPADQGWESAVRTLEKLDPSRIYSAPLHDRLMPPSGV
nr:cholesterol oxidase substrate-binding domain-containing protein [Kocuria atrinae]